MSHAKGSAPLNSGLHLSEALERIEVSMKDGEIECVKTLFGASDGFRDTFRDGPTWRDSFGDGGQWESSFNNWRRSDGISHPAIQDALLKLSYAIARTTEQPPSSQQPSKEDTA